MFEEIREQILADLNQQILDFIMLHCVGGMPSSEFQHYYINVDTKVLPDGFLPITINEVRLLSAFGKLEGLYHFVGWRIEVSATTINSVEKLVYGQHFLLHSYKKTQLKSETYHEQMEDFQVPMFVG